MELTLRVKRLSEKFDMEAEDVAYADLIHAGWGKVEAAYFVYHLAYFEQNKINVWLKDKLKLTPGINKMIAELDEEAAAERKRLKELEKKLSNKKDKLQKEAEKNKEITEESLRTKTGMLDYLIELAATPGLDLRTKADLAKQITDLQNYKKEEIKQEQTHINFYLPLTCAKCSLYKEFKNKKREEHIEIQKTNNNDADSR